MASPYVFEIDGYVFPRRDAPARGPVVEFPPQKWAEQVVLGASSPGSILTLMGHDSQEWRYISRASAATKDKLLAVYNARNEVIFKTPQNTTGFKALMTELTIQYAEPIEDNRFLCEFTLVSRAALPVSETEEEEEDVATIVVKSAHETINNSATLQDDNELFFSVLNGEVWMGTVNLSVAIKAASDFKFTMTGPVDVTISHIFYRGDIPVSAPTQFNGVVTVLSASDQNIGIGFDFLCTANADGVVKLQWAQNVAVAEDTSVHARSHIIAHKKA